jgi:hypothetical protein
MKTISTLVLIFIYVSSISQLTIVNANINEYNISKSSLSQITISNMEFEGTVRIESQITSSSNEVLLKLISNPIVVKKGINNLNNHTLNFSQLIYSSSPQGSFIKNMHRLPSGGYNYCVSVIPVSGIEEGDELCQTIDASSDDQMYLVNPQDEEEIPTSTPILIWLHTEPFNLLSQGEFFRLTVAEISSSQKAAEAIVNNVPVYYANYVSKHQVQYPADATKLKPGKKYAWMVQKISNGNILASTDVWEFKMSENTNVSDHVYIDLKTKLDGSIYTVQDDRIYFKYDERYQSKTLNAKIYSDAREEIKVQSKNEQSAQVSSKTMGYNSYELDLKPYKLKKGYYTLEVLNEKHQKFMLKFYVD